MFRLGSSSRVPPSRFLSAREGGAPVGDARARPMLLVALGSAAFLIAAGILAAVSFCAILPISFSRRAVRFARQRLWTRPTLFLLRGLCDVRYEVLGAEKIPDGPCIFASKHQSVWEIFFFCAHFRDLVFVLKREMYWIPLLGYYMWRDGMIPLDRGRGVASARRLRREALSRRFSDEKVIVFPEGTRTFPGERGRYHGGVALLAEALEMPVVPVALNSGFLWGRRKFLKHPGRITVRFLDPLPRGLSGRALTALLEERIEAACADLPSPKPVRAGRSGQGAG